MHKSLHEAVTSSRPATPFLCAECVTDVVRAHQVKDSEGSLINDVAAHLTQVIAGYEPPRFQLNGTECDMRAVTVLSGTYVCGRALHISYVRGTVTRDR